MKRRTFLAQTAGLTAALALPGAVPAAPSPFKYVVGQQYLTQAGKWITVLGRTTTRGYETLICSDKRHRYDRSTDSVDAGRCTGTHHDYSYPHNIVREDRPCSSQSSRSRQMTNS
jgi:hypothetical protein